MSTKTTALKAALQTEVDAITDALARAEADVCLDRYVAALTSQEKLETGAIQSYTIAGRTVTRRNPTEGRGIIENLRAELYGYLRGHVAYVNMGGYV